jgi:methylenetetrahydrofolate reductase (NADPH)
MSGATNLSPAPMPGCPKSMHYGPCGGVSADGTCEVAPTPCVFIDVKTVTWPAPHETAVPAPSDNFPNHRTAAATEVLAIASARPLIITGLPAAPMSSESLARCADILRGSVDAVLSGDSGRARVQFPPSYRAELIRTNGLRAWLGVNCRDRNRVALEGELLALADAGVAGVHCVTGDHTDLGDRPDAKPVFDLEGIQVVPRAREAGLLVSVAESPASPPVNRRAARLVEKVHAGAQFCFPQYSGGASDTDRYINEVRAAGVDIPFIAGVPVVIDRVGAELLASFAAAILPDGFIDGILSATDPFEAGIRASVKFATELLEIDGVAGIAAAGGARVGQELQFAEALARIAAELGGGAPVPILGGIR